MPLKLLAAQTCLSLLLGTVGVARAASSPVPKLEPPKRPSYDQKALAAVLVAEAGIENVAGMTAVAEVIRNRAREKEKTPLEVVRQHRIFSSLNGITLAQLIHKQESNPRFSAALAIAETLLVHPESLPNTTNNATHFDNIAKTPYWAAKAKVTSTIGRHRFYRTAY
jgi:spore germination cell wall hydrolase CwlJ-like protein